VESYAQFVKTTSSSRRTGSSAIELVAKRSDDQVTFSTIYEGRLRRNFYNKEQRTPYSPGLPIVEKNQPLLSLSAKNKLSGYLKNMGNNDGLIS
jgi:hypothetical protein